MGFSGIAAGVGAAAAVAGAGISYEQGQNASAATAEAQQQQQEQQDQAFQTRQSAAQQQLQQQSAINDAAETTFSKNQAAQQADQIAALQSRSQTTAGENAEEQAIATAANKVVDQGTQNANASQLAAAQANQVAAQNAANAPVTAEVAATNPLGAADEGATQSAMDASTGAAAKYVQKYGNTLATLSGYQAPITLANQQATTIGTNLMPAQEADTLLKTGAPALLEPSTTAYQQAGAYGSAVNTANAANQQNALQLVATETGNADDLANLTQSDQGVTTQNQLTLAQQRAAQLAGLGGALTSLGNTGIQYGASQGAFSSKPSADQPFLDAASKHATAIG